MEPKDEEESQIETNEEELKPKAIIVEKEDEEIEENEEIKDEKPKD